MTDNELELLILMDSAFLFDEWYDCREDEEESYFEKNLKAERTSSKEKGS